MPSLVTTGAAFCYALPFLLVFLVVSTGIGWALLRFLGVSDHSSVAERLLIALLLGAAALQFVPFSLGAAGVLSTTSVRSALAVVLLLALPGAWAAFRAARLAARSFVRPPTWVWVWGLALLPGLVVALLLALTPTLDPDGLGYHLTVPKRWLEAGSLRYLPTYPYSNTPMGVEMLFMSGMAVAGDTAAKCIHFALGIGGAVGLYLTGKRLGGRPVGMLAVAAYLFGPMGVGVLLGWAYLEGATSAVLVGATLAWVIWFQERDRAWLRCGVLLAGFAVSFKLTAGLFPVALAALTITTLLHEARTSGSKATSAVLSLLPLVPLLALPVLPWLVRSAIVTGNPVFPMGAQWIPSRDFSGPLAAKFEHYNRYMVWGINLGPSWDLERRRKFFNGIALAVLACGGLVAWRQRTFMARATAWVALGTVLVQLGAAGLYKRYWIPVFSVFQLLAIAMFARELSARWARSAILAVTALGSLFQARQSLKSVDMDALGLLRTALGVESQREFATRHDALFPIYEFANSQLSSSAGVMMSEYCGGFYLDRASFCADITQEALRYTDFSTFVGDLRRLGITHAIAPRAWAELGSKPRMEGGNVSMLVREQEHAQVSVLLRDHARLLVAADNQGLYALDLGSLPQRAPERPNASEASE